VRRVLVELCAGTAAVSLRAMAGRPVQPLTGYMGGKRRWATQLAELLGYGAEPPDYVVLVDAGPWGDVWDVLRIREHRRRVAHQFREVWAGADPHYLWSELVKIPPPATDPAFRCAQYLWLQARSAGTIPIWWSVERGRWESPTGSRTEAAHERGGAAADGRQTGQEDAPSNSRGRRLGAAYEAGLYTQRAHQKARDDEGSRRLGGAYQKDTTRRGDGSGDASRRQKQKHVRGIQNPGTIAARIDAIEDLPWHRVHVVREDLRRLQPIAGADVLFDPPYAGCPRYAALCPRRDVLTVARAWATKASRVVVCEGEPLADLAAEGWHAARMHAEKTSAGGGGRTTREEWLTATWPIALPEQLGLWKGAA
jgi:hypothetical protein